MKTAEKTTRVLLINSIAYAIGHDISPSFIRQVVEDELSFELDCEDTEDFLETFSFKLKKKVA